MIQKCVLFLIFIVFLSSAYEGSVKISGRLECNGKSWRDEKVAVYETNYVLPDTFFNSTFTDNNGNFTLEGFGVDMYPIRPYIYIANYCESEKFLGHEWARHLRIRIPAFFIDKFNRKSTILMNLGVIELKNADGEQIGMQKFSDFVKNFAENREIVDEKLKVSEM